MRYRLRTILLLTLLVALPLGLFKAWQHRQWKSNIPVTDAMAVPDHSFMPKGIRVRYGNDAKEWLVVGRTKQTARQNAPRSKATVADVIEDPYDHQSICPDNVQEYLSNPDELVSALLSALQKPPPTDEESNHATRFNRIKYAEMLVRFDHAKTAIDWAVNELTHGRYLDGEELALVCLSETLPEQIEDPWQFIRPYVLSESSTPWSEPWRLEAEEFCMEHCPEQFIDWCCASIGNEELRWEQRNRCFLISVDERLPSLELLKAAKSLFSDVQNPPRMLTGDGATAVSRLAKKLPTKECHALIAEYAHSRIEKTEDSACEHLFAQYADQSWMPIIRERATKGCVAAVNALIRLDGKLTNEFLFETATAGCPLRDRSLRELASRFEGTGDERLIELLAERSLHPGAEHTQEFHDHSVRDGWLGWIRRVGGLERALELREQWEREDPSSYFRKGRVMHENGLNLDDLLKTLRSAGFAKTLTAEQVRAKVISLDLARHPQFIRPGDELSTALEMASLKTRVNISETKIEPLLQRFSEMTGGEFEIDSVSVQEGCFRFGWKDRAFECDRGEDSYFDGIAMANVLNAILDRFGHKNRFLGFHGHYEDYDFFFGDPEFAKELHLRFGVAWQPGTEAYWSK